MNETHKELLIELVKKERMRLTVALSTWRRTNGTYEEMATLNEKRDLCNSTIKSLTGGE